MTHATVMIESKMSVYNAVVPVLSIRLRFDLLFANAEATSALSSATVLVWSKKVSSQSAKQYDEVVASQVR